MYLQLILREPAPGIWKRQPSIGQRQTVYFWGLAPLGSDRWSGLPMTNADALGGTLYEDTREVKALRRALLNAVVNNIGLVCSGVVRVG